MRTFRSLTFSRDGLVYSVKQTKQYEFKGATGLIQPEQSGKAEAQKGTKCHY